jgi:hypothetical protein
MVTKRKIFLRRHHKLLAKIEVISYGSKNKLKYTIGHPRELFCQMVN